MMFDHIRIWEQMNRKRVRYFGGLTAARSPAEDRQRGLVSRPAQLVQLRDHEIGVAERSGTLQE